MLDDLRNEDYKLLLDVKILCKCNLEVRCNHGSSYKLYCFFRASSRYRGGLVRASNAYSVPVAVSIEKRDMAISLQSCGCQQVVTEIGAK